MSPKRASRAHLALELLGTFFLIGLFTFGGGFSMIPLISRELVERRKWLKEEEFQEDLAVAVPIPGPNAVNLAFLVGHRVAGPLGAALAALGCVLPSFLVILAIALGLSPFFQTPLAKKFFAGAGAAATGLVAYALVRLGRNPLKGIRTWVIGVFALVLLFLRLHPLLVLALAFLGSLLWERVGKNAR
ncbi:MAG: chromate transporter [Candidatus Bipolaricaulaceae bacterium]